MIKRNGNTTYLCLFGIRFVWRDGSYIGWYRPRLNKEV